MPFRNDGGDDDGSELGSDNGSRLWHIYEPVTDCATSGHPRRIHGRETWKFLQDAYIYSKSRGDDDPDFDSYWGRNEGKPHHGFQVEFEVRDDGPRGRSIYAVDPIPKGTVVYRDERSAIFKGQSELNLFLQLLPNDLQCDILLWAYPMAGGRALVALDEGSFVNHGDEVKVRNMDGNCRTMRDVAANEELLEDYGEYLAKDGGGTSWFDEARRRAWRETDMTQSIKLQSGGVERYNKVGVPEASQGQKLRSGVERYTQVGGHELTGRGKTSFLVNALCSAAVVGVMYKMYRGLSTSRPKEEKSFL
ncbi:hypothetical protein ACHAWF_015739 [Thalassiosira exigua]